MCWEETWRLQWSMLLISPGGNKPRTLFRSISVDTIIKQPTLILPVPMRSIVSEGHREACSSIPVLPPLCNSLFFLSCRFFFFAHCTNCMHLKYRCVFMPWIHKSSFTPNKIVQLVRHLSHTKNVLQCIYFILIEKCLTTLHTYIFCFYLCI